MDWRLTKDAELFVDQISAVDKVFDVLRVCLGCSVVKVLQYISRELVFGNFEGFLGEGS